MGYEGEGWINQELFRHWLKHHFVSSTVAGCPLLHIFDGHVSHYDPYNIEMDIIDKRVSFCSINPLIARKTPNHSIVLCFRDVDLTFSQFWHILDEH